MTNQIHDRSQQDHPLETTMSAMEVVLPSMVEPSGLIVRHRPMATPARGHVILRMDATGVSFAEQQMRRGKYYDQPPFPFVPGYDIVGTVAAAGPGVDQDIIGRRYAAVTKTGSWATLVQLRAEDLLPIPADLDAADVETLVVNGITAWQMLHRRAHVHAGNTILVHGANGGVGSTLVQLARHAGVRVIGTASTRHHDMVRALGAEPVDYADPALETRVRELAPSGVDAVFDHVGGDGIRASFRLLARGGTLVSYGSAASKNEAGASQKPILLLVGRLMWWNAAPNSRRATFYNFWAGARRRRAFQSRLREDLTEVLKLLAEGALTPLVATRMPLDQAAAALELAESRTTVGKVILVPPL